MIYPPPFSRIPSASCPSFFSLSPHFRGRSLIMALSLNHTPHSPSPVVVFRFSFAPQFAHVRSLRSEGAEANTLSYVLFREKEANFETIDSPPESLCRVGGRKVPPLPLMFPSSFAFFWVAPVCRARFDPSKRTP